MIRSFKNQVLLVATKTPDTFWSFDEASQYLGASTAHAPLTLKVLAGLFGSDWHVRTIDMNVQPLNEDDLFWADAVFLTGMVVHREGMADVIARCKSAGKPVVVGGPFATATPEAPELTDASAIFLGEAIDKMAFGKMLAGLQAGTLEKTYQAVPSPSLDQSPIPLFDLINWRQYANACIQVSCGCLFRCKYCQVWKHFGRPRYKKPEQVIAELQALYDSGYRGTVFVVDDNYSSYPDAALEVTEAIYLWQKTYGFPLQFLTQADIRLANNEVLARKMASAGFQAVFVGLESPDRDVLRKMNKGQNVRIDAVEAVRNLRKWGLLVYCGLIIGNDNDPPDIFEQMFEFIRDLKCSRAMLGLLMAIPGTDLYDELLAVDRILPEVSGDQTARTNVKPLNGDLEGLTSRFRDLFCRIYSPKEYFRRGWEELKEWTQVRSGRTQLREYRAAFLSITKQGFGSKYRRHYWKFMLKVLFRRPWLLGRAFAIAISGTHYISYAEKIRDQKG